MGKPLVSLEALFEKAVSAADPNHILSKYLPDQPKGRTVVVGAGKGAAQMAAALEQAWEEAKYGALEGFVVTRYGFGEATKKIKVVEAAHPEPDLAGHKAAIDLMKQVSGLTEDDLVIALIAGGGSALLPLPPETVSLEDKIEMNRVLLASGAPISAMNTIRKCVSQIKGGRLAACAYPARVVSLIVSDIPGDHLAHVASGPTVADETTRQDALEIVERYRMTLPQSVMDHLHNDDAQELKPSDPRLKNVTNHLIASAAKSLEAVAQFASAPGIETVILSDAMEGEASQLAKAHAAMVREILHRNRPFQKPVLILSGGECTVTIKNDQGRGGPNSEFALSLGIDLAEEEGWSALVADTDGIDGSGDNAGAFVDGNTIGKMRSAGIDPKTALVRNESYKAFSAIDQLFSPGPTGTNVNDFRAILVTG